MQINIDTTRLFKIAKDSESARLTERLRKERMDREKEENRKRQLTAAAEKKLAEILASIPGELEKAAPDGYMRDDGRCIISAKILLASAVNNSLHKDEYNPNLAEEDRYLIVAVKSKLWGLNNSNPNMWFDIVSNTKPNREKANPEIDSHFNAYTYLEVTLTSPMDKEKK